MTVNMDFKIDARVQKKILAQFNRFEIQAGILDDAPHKRPLPASRGLASVAGGPARKKSGRIRGTNAQVGEIVRKVHGVDYLRKPFRNGNSPDMKVLRAALIQFLAGLSKSRHQVETALRAVIRNPILQGKYGRNTRAWARVKTFNRKLFDTGQFYTSIIARVRSKKNVQG